MKLKEKLVLLLLVSAADSLPRGIVAEVVTQLVARQKAVKASVRAAARCHKAFYLTAGKPPFLM